MSKVRIIGICGYARSGKNEAAKGLSDTWKQVGFADALKQEALIAIRLSLIAAGHNPPPDLGTLFTNPETKELYRPFLVEYGRTMRKLDPDHWVRRLFREMDKDSSYVITDVRYENEVAFVRKEGGLVIEIIRPGVGPANEEEKVSMERVNADYHIYNNGTVEQLHKQVADYIKEKAEA